MNVLVTGSSGGIGRYIVNDLVEAGHTVLGVDVNFPASDAPGQFLRVDLTQAGEIYNALARAEADLPLRPVEIGRRDPHGRLGQRRRRPRSAHLRRERARDLQPLPGLR